MIKIGPEEKRSNRITILTKMAMSGKSWKEIRETARGYASKATAEEYLKEVERRMRIIQNQRISSLGTNTTN